VRVRFKKADLLPAAGIVQSVANPQSTLPILGHVLVSAEHDNVATLVATDYETRVRIEVPAEVGKKGRMTVPARNFHDLVKELPEDTDLTVESKSKQAFVSAGRVRAELNTAPADDFPPFPEMVPTVEFEMEQRRLKRLLSKILFAVPTRDPRKVLLGALFEFKDGRLNVVATDGKILACARAAVDNRKGPRNFSAIIPHKMLEELMRNLGDEGLVTAAFDERQVSFQLGDIKYISNQIEGNYPNYEAVLPKDYSRRLQFPKQAMLMAIRRASVLSDIRSLAVTLTFSGSQVTVEAESIDKGRIRDEVPATNDGEEFRITFNHKFVQEALKCIDQDEIRLNANSPVLPAVFEGVDESDCMYLVMPIKLTDLRRADEEPEDSAPEPVDEEGGGEEEDA
jgi:DNA polymerase-3 subunit beta